MFEPAVTEARLLVGAADEDDDRVMRLSFDIPQLGVERGDKFVVVSFCSILLCESY